MKLIVGLGNPGKEYEATRHNVGFMCVDLLKDKLSFPDFALNKKFNALISEGTFNNLLYSEKVILAKPQTFMNVSGECVQKLFSFYQCVPSDLFVVYDDIDLPLGSLRIRQKGSAGTHNGMKSICTILGRSDFPRLRIGIESRGASAPDKQDLTSFVLHPFKKEEKRLLSETLEKAADTLEIYWAWKKTDRLCGGL